MWRLLLASLLVFNLARADPVTEGADAVLAAFRAKADLEGLARRDAPDPWMVADMLCARGEFEAGDAFARAAPRKDTEKLPAYVAARRGRPDDGSARLALAAANEALAAGDAEQALVALGGIDLSEAGVVQVCAALARGHALLALGRPAESEEAIRAVAEMTGKLGWLALQGWALHESGLRALDRSDCRAAIERFEACLRLGEARGNRTAMAAALTNAGGARHRLGEYAEALLCHERALRLLEELGDRAGVGICLSNLGVVHQSLGNHRSVLAHVERLLKLAEELGDRPTVMDALVQIGTAHLMLGNYAESLDFYERGLHEAEALGHRQGIADALGGVGNAHCSLGDYLKALSYQERALKLVEELGDRAGVAAGLVNLGVIHKSLGDYPKALDFFERGLQEAETSGARQWAANALMNIAGVQEMLGDYSSALACRERAAKLIEALGDHAGMALAHVVTGTIHHRLGNLEKALASYDRGLREAEAHGHRPATANALGGIINVLITLGDYPKALSLQTRALRLYEESGDRAGVARALGGFGLIYQSLGDYPRALSYLEKVLALWEELGDPAGTAATLANIGSNYSACGEYAKALAYYERALRLAEELRDPSGMAAGLGSVGLAHQYMGDHAKALSYGEQALAIEEGLGNRAGVAQALGQIGLAHESLGEYSTALSYYERTLRESTTLGIRPMVVRSHCRIGSTRLLSGDAQGAVAACRQAVEVLGGLATGLAEEEGAKAREQFRDVFEAGTAAAQLLGDPGEVCYFLESGRAMTLLEALGGRDSIREAAIPEELRIEEAEARAGEELATKRHMEALKGGLLDRIREAKAALHAAQAKVAEAIDRIQREAKAGAGIVYPEADDIEVIRTRLREEEALVLYAHAGTDALALVVTRETARIVSLGSVQAIEKACAGDHAALTRLVAAPLKLDAKRVFVSPAGTLSYVPFVLVMPGREVVYLPSGTTYGLLLQEARGARGEGVLALGDPDYGTEIDPTEIALLRSGHKLVPLPGTREEVKEVGDIVLLGREATEAALAAKLASRARWRAVHLACHGLLDPERPRFSALALSGGEFLTTADVFRMRMPADLVVLSACETAKGKVYSAEGVVGFVRAFMFAGAPRVLVSLWKVDDEATKALMVRFYELWKGGKACATALKEAQESVAAQEKWRDPKYWAAWQLWGLPD